MNVDLYERIWVWGVGVVLALFFTSTAVAAFGHQIHPPSHIETVNPNKALADPRFRKPGVSVEQDGRVHARVVGLMFTWMPAEMTIPADTLVTFHLTSIDVIHS